MLTPSTDKTTSTRAELQLRTLKPYLAPGRPATYNRSAREYVCSTWPVSRSTTCKSTQVGAAQAARTHPRLHTTAPTTSTARRQNIRNARFGSDIVASLNVHAGLYAGRPKTGLT